MTEGLFDMIKQGATIRQMELVLETESSLECRNERQETPLMAAMINIHDPQKREKTLLLFIEHNANINCTNVRGQTPLMYACILDLAREMRILLNEPRLECNVQDFEGNTALMYACALSKTSAVETLVNSSCCGQIQLDPYVMNLEGTSAFDYARENPDETIMKQLGRLITESTVYNYDKEKRESHTSAAKAKGKRKKVRARDKAAGIHRLAIDVKNDISVSDSQDEKRILVWKEGSNGHPTIAVDTDSNEHILDSEGKQEEENKTQRRKSVIMNIHLPQACDDDCDTGIMTCNEHTSNSNETKIIDDGEIPSTSGLVTGLVCLRKNKQHKCKGKRTRKKKRIQTSTSKATDLGIMNSKAKDFGEEIMFCNKIYGADPYPCSGGLDDCYGDVDAVLANIKRKMSGHMNPTLDSEEWGKTTIPKGTGKMDCMKLSAAERAKLLSRTIWSVYGAPLPPIPISMETVHRVMSGISKLRQYLGKAKYQPGRLLSLDPEMWCIIESIKHESYLRDQSVLRL